MAVFRMMWFGLVTMLAMPMHVGTADDGELKEPGTPPPSIERDMRPGQDADGDERTGPAPRARPRVPEDWDHSPRTGEGCPYRGRKLDLIV